MSGENKDLEAARNLALRSKLIKELTKKIASLVSDFLDNPEVKTLNETDQISCIYSSLITLWVSYKFNDLIPIPLDQNAVSDAEEIMRLEEQFKKGMDNEQG